MTDSEQMRVNMMKLYERLALVSQTPEHHAQLWKAAQVMYCRSMGCVTEGDVTIHRHPYLVMAGDAEETEAIP